MIRLLVIVTCILAVSAFAFAQEAQAQRAPRILIAFFSHTNNTRAVAEEIQRQVGGDLFHITTKTPYPSNHQQTVQMARNERDRNSRPELATTIPVEVMQQYDVIFLGYPNWWMTMPMAVRTFLDQYDLSGKHIVPFCTHEGSGLSNTVNELREMFPQANVLQGLAVNGRMASRAQNDVTSWLHALRFIR
jgi:flavodoxin